MRAQSISAVFQDGGRRPEVVFHDGSLCGGRVFSMDDDCLSVAQLVLAVGHTGTGPEDHFRSAVATVENTWNLVVEKLEFN